MRWVAWFGAAILALVLFFAPNAAQAYPQWQFSAGSTRCNQCHYSPSGGGLLNGYGRDAVSDELSTWDGNGDFMHGAVSLPSYLKLGLDARFALASNDNGGPDQPKTAVFPMQFDAHLRLDFGQFALQAIGGVRGQLRRGEAPIPTGSFQPENDSRLVSREHWAIWQPAALGFYVRAGRFFAPFGLRLAEHLVYVRRDLGFNTLEESYNVSAGYLKNEWEAHVTAFAADFLQSGSTASGIAAYGEKRLFDEKAGLAVQVKYSSQDDVKRLIAGVVGKGFVEPAKLLFMGEANYVQHMPNGVSSVGQFVGLLGASWLPPLKGSLVTLWAERLQGDINTVGTGVNAWTGLVSWFPIAHFELQLVGRTQQSDGGQKVHTFLAQVHYFL